MSAIAFDIRYTSKLMNKRNNTLIQQLKGKKAQIAVMGLCEKGMEITLSMKEKYNTLGFSLDKIKSRHLQIEHQQTENIVFTSIPEALKDIKMFLFPICKSNSEEEVKALFKVILPYLKNSIIIFEANSPKFVENLCIPFLEKESGLRLNKDFSIGFSPIDTTSSSIASYTKSRKVISASSVNTLNTIYDIFNEIIQAGVYKAPSIKDALTFSKLLPTSTKYAIS